MWNTTTRAINKRQNTANQGISSHRLWFRRTNNVQKGSLKGNKSYILPFTFSLSKAIHMELVPNQTTKEFICVFKRLIVRRGVQEKRYLDNAKTFVVSCKRVKKFNKSEALNYLFKVSIRQDGDLTWVERHCWGS